MEQFRSALVNSTRAGATADISRPATRPNRAGVAFAGHPTARRVRAVGPRGSKIARRADYWAVLIATSISENNVATTASISNNSPFI